MVLFSLIKTFKEPTLFIKAGFRPGTVCVSVICHPPLSLRTCHPLPHWFSVGARYLSLGVRTYSKCAYRPSNQTVDKNSADAGRDALRHSVALGWYVEDLVTLCLFNFKRQRQGWEHLG